MKIRESGMPEMEYWESLFDVPLILSMMGLDGNIDEAIEFGSGYGTFTIPTAMMIRGRMISFDIDPLMIEFAKSRQLEAGIKNLQIVDRDLVEDGTGLSDDSVDYVMLFNILHHDDPSILLREAFRILRNRGRAGAVHWRYDPSTPRGPEMSIRPKPEAIAAVMMETGFSLETPWPIDLPPYHYGILGKKELEKAKEVSP